MRCSACGSRKVHTAPELYPGGIESEITPERLNRFFEREDAWSVAQAPAEARPKRQSASACSGSCARATSEIGTSPAALTLILHWAAVRSVGQAVTGPVGDVPSPPSLTAPHDR